MMFFNLFEIPMEDKPLQNAESCFQGGPWEYNPLIEETTCSENILGKQQK